MQDGQPIFILGIAPRSGTNYLSDLLCVHPDCETPAPFLEDYLLHHAHHLAAYANAVSSSWQPRWGVECGHEDRLWRCLGSGLITLLAARAGERRLITKTPSVRNLPHFFRLFPDARLLLLIRDGRAVVESVAKSFGVRYDWAMHQWARAARTIVDFERTVGSAHRSYRIVRYEALCNDLQTELPDILKFVGLDSAVYDFDTASNLPVRGSSETSIPGEHSVNWEPLPKSADFDPVRRWRNWKRFRHERFNWIAGRSQLQLGYENCIFSGHRPMYAACNVALDARWLIAGVLNAIRTALIAAWRNVRKRNAAGEPEISGVDQGRS